MLQIEFVSKDNIFAEDQSTKDILKKGSFGTEEGKKLKLTPEEALYLIDVRNAECRRKEETISFNGLASKFWTAKKFIARYLTYKDWRDRGLVIRQPGEEHSQANKTPIKQYPKSEIKLPTYSFSGVFFKTDMVSIVEDKEKGKYLYENLWLGQYGSYKAPERGQLNKLDILETTYLLEKGMLRLTNTTQREVRRIAHSRRRDFERLYEVYREWRDLGYVIKTGFKFGTHFRVYFPGAKPMTSENKDWVHSKHVIHVFPKESRMLISEWARAIRVAHSVRKTFILAVPGKRAEPKVKPDYILFHRKGGEAENPKTGAPRYAMLSLSEDEYIGGMEFAGAINEAKRRKLELVMAIADRETAVTYYKIRQIKLANSQNEYYEIDWMQP
ncbi:MAG: tRNA-intron lyase [Candidatus Micrarchaeota archaeon]|nr:tRNA-intron lyase [Candidatus Micrarchaeota archaeon]MDE1850122.1 tRNA-intron lyase [Candidatus Micrarchaeota archaeon]